MKWIPIEAPPKTGEEVICFNPDWVDADFNPRGTRIGFLHDDERVGWLTAFWLDYQDTYVQRNSDVPTHWCAIPIPPAL